MKFIAEYHLLKDQGQDVRIIEIGEDVDHFQIEDKVKDDTRVSFEGGDIMMISKDHILIGCSERTSPYAIHKFIHRVFKETLATTVTVIKISEKRSQMHIDTVLSHLRRDAWIMFGQLSERWQKEKKEKGSYLFEYADSIRQKSRNELKKEKLVTITQFYCPYGKYKEKENYQVYTKAEVDLMGKRGEIPKNMIIQSYENLAPEGFGYKRPEGLEDLLRQISVVDFGVASEEVKVIYSGGGVSPHDEREQWTDACNLLVIKEGIAVGYDRNRKTAASFEHLMLGFKTDKTPSKTSVKAARKRKFASMSEDRKNFLKWNLEQRKKAGKPHLEISDLDFHLIYAIDLIDYFKERLQKQDIERFIDKMENTLILLPSNELSRARGGSHCMSMPLWREKY